MTKPFATHFACHLLALLLLAGCASQPKLDYAQARARAQLDEDSLSGEQVKAAALATESVLNEIEDRCHFERTGFSYVFRLNDRGIIKEMWTDDANTTTTCLYKAFRGRTLYVPPREPFYTFIQWMHAPSLINRTLFLGINDNSPLQMEGTGRLAEQDGHFTLRQLAIRFAGNPDNAAETVTVRSLHLRLSASLDSENDTRPCDYGQSPHGWGCGFTGTRLPVNLVLRRGETLKLDNLVLKLEIPAQKLQRHRWFAVQVEAETDQGTASTSTEVGFL